MNELTKSIKFIQHPNVTRAKMPNSRVAVFNNIFDDGFWLELAILVKDGTAEKPRAVSTNHKNKVAVTGFGLSKVAAIALMNVLKIELERM